MGNVSCAFKMYMIDMKKNSKALDKLFCQNERTARIRASDAHICP